MMHLVLKYVGLGKFVCLYKGNDKEYATTLHLALSRSNENETYLYLFVLDLENYPTE